MVGRPIRPAATTTTVAAAMAAAPATALFRGSVVLGFAMGLAWGAGNAVGEGTPGGEHRGRWWAPGQPVRKVATRMLFATAALGVLNAIDAELRAGGRERQEGTPTLLATTPWNAQHIVRGPAYSRFGAFGFLCSAVTSGSRHNSGGCWELTRIGNPRY